MATARASEFRGQAVCPAPQAARRSSRRCKVGPLSQEPLIAPLSVRQPHPTGAGPPEALTPLLLFMHAVRDQLNGRDRQVAAGRGLTRRCRRCRRRRHCARALQVQPTQAVAQVDQVQKITVSTNGAQEFGATDMARVSGAWMSGHDCGWLLVAAGSRCCNNTSHGHGLCLRAAALVDRRTSMHPSGLSSRRGRQALHREQQVGAAYLFGKTLAPLG